MQFYKEKFNSAGWFIPPYVSIGYLQEVVKDITENGNADLESSLAFIYNEKNLAAMVTERYPEVPIVNEYLQIIKESIEAHFIGLDHVAVSGLIPVVEGIGRKFAKANDINESYVKNVFVKFAEHCKEDVTTNRIGVVNEIVAMLDSFVHFAKENLYVNSDKYPHNDNTNRHGILHGAFSDTDYGSPLNFYKVIGAVDFLCFVVSIREPISFLGPDTTLNSISLEKYYRMLSALKSFKSNG
ncbi:hypothetical protein [Pseudocolwellia sp. HL-MZ7]|uniref:hypothetical protein n=1 Tax=Pseudocolwellia sp. HL-MZ7 TaxID=3400627 RepID=UPI003CEC5428